MKKTISQNQLKQLQREKKIQGYSIQKKPGKRNHLVQLSKEKQWILTFLKEWSKRTGYSLETEYLFFPQRKWRFDFCFRTPKIAIEYEGIFSSMSRHTSIRGFIGDVEKYNHAQVLGYSLIRLTAADYKKLPEYLTLLLKHKNVNHAN